MIDWFVSKIGTIISILIISSCLFYFVEVQKDIFDRSVDVVEKNNIDNIVDSLCDGCWVKLSNGTLVNNNE